MNKFNSTIALVSFFCCNTLVIAQSDTNNVVTKEDKPASIHIFQAGDSLFLLSKKYDVSIENLKIWNGIKNVTRIANGRTIYLTNNKEKKSVSKPKNTLTLKEKAEAALTSKKYRLAITLLTKLYQQGNEKERQFALEFLGLSRDKKGQKAFAKQAYQSFLKEYPKALTAPRVQLRLDNLIGIETLSKNRKLSQGKKNKQRKKPSYFRGSVSSDYRQSALVNDLGESRDTLSLANVDVNAKGNIQRDSYNIGFQVSMGHYQDLLPESDKTNEQIRYLNVSAKSDDKLYQVTFGRQRSRDKGVFGRFDGIVLSSEVIDDIKLNVVAGYPVASSKITRIDTERQFYGVSVDIDNSWKDIDFSLFVFDQSIGNITDRRAIGGKLSYFQDSTSLYSLIDYDIFFNELNALLFSGSYTTELSQRLSWSLNYRKSPYVGTRNALIGQSVDSFTELQNLFITDEEILDLALDRTLTSKTASFQFYQPINEFFDINASLTWMNLSDAPESGGVPAISKSGGQYYANINLSGKNLYSGRDVNRFGFRYSSLASSNVYSLYVSSRYRLENGLSLMPKLRFDDRSNDNGTSQQSISPTLRLQYQSKKHYLYTDVGGIFYTSKSTLIPSQQTSIYYVYLGYRYYF